ncbi:hypothetical protein AJ88_34035 [Mesorhizobium amorphae CCBAU 01583]|nr:hypothetical protein AJ88_34035 [Mesorhizobium amorphae CCBAU 01583]
MRTPASVRQYLDADQARLYELIWKRAIASQMQPAEIERTTVEIEAVNGARTAELRAVGSVVRFDGFIAAYTDQKDEDAEDEESRRLPEIRAGEQLARQAINATQHTTEPPPRYSEASLIKKLEELGIGRPSTYTAILKTLEDRDYVEIDKPSWCRRPRAGCCRPSSKASSSAMSNMISPPRSRKSSTRFPTASSPGKMCCATSGRTFPALSPTSRNCASPTCSMR